MVHSTIFSVDAEAVPKRILELMNVEKLTRENVASHLQARHLPTLFNLASTRITVFSYVLWFISTCNKEALNFCVCSDGLNFTVFWH